MWKLRTGISRALLCLFLFSWLSPASFPDVVLTDAEAAEIRQILTCTKRKAVELRITLEASRTESAELSSRLDQVEKSLEETALKWEQSEISLIDCLKALEEARRSLETLKADYLALSSFLTRQRRAAGVWRAIALTSAAVAVVASADELRDFISWMSK